MRSISYAELLEASGLSPVRLKEMRRMGYLATAFGRGDIFDSLGYIELDAVGIRLNDVLAEKLNRTLASEIVRDQWGIWQRVVALAETSPDTPTFFYAIGYDSAKGQRHYMTIGSMLDSRSDVNLRAIVEDLKKRAGVTAKDYVVVEMQSVLADVRAAAKKAKLNFDAPFLPPYGSDELEDILDPFEKGNIDRAVIVIDKAMKVKAADLARRAGILARANVEAKL